MLDHLWTNPGEVKNYLPYVSFLAGITGSLHCVGMCGGLVTASCSNSKDVFRYQTGRLLGYLFLGLVAGVLGQSFSLKFDSQIVTLIGSLTLGAIFIYWGVSTFFGRKAELPLPKWFSKIYQYLWQRLVKGNQNFSRSFFVGLISILLPCGLLYGVVIATFALGHFTEALQSMLFFWLGTLPAMIVAPVAIQKFLRPFKSRLPKVYAIGLILIGLATIYGRLPHQHSDHSHTVPSDEKNRCH